MDFKKVLPTIAALAPNLATALGGPLAGMGLSALLQALGINPAAPDKEAQVAAALQNMTPETALALKKADQDFAVKLKELDINLEEINAKDRDSARNMQIQTQDWTPRVLAFFIVVGFLSLLTAMAFVTIPVSNEKLLDIMTGTLGTLTVTIATFYFGSSSGSQKKDALLAAK